MPSRAERVGIVTLICLGLAGCASSGGSGGGKYRPVSDVPIKIGPPYTVRGVTYYPRDDRRYDAVGMASWYGSESGNRTANGERFRPAAISAAHKTLPLPSYVEVTALATGRTILLRINDRGPFHPGRIIDLSRGAAESLGILRDGQARVRVRRVDPPESDRAALRAGRSAAPRRATASLPPTSRLVLDLPPPERNDPAPGWYVQVGTFADEALAERLLPDLATLGPPQLAGGGGLWRARLGPYGEEEARAALAQARSRGYQDAVLVRPDATQ